MNGSSFVMKLLLFFYQLLFAGARVPRVPLYRLNRNIKISLRLMLIEHRQIRVRQPKIYVREQFLIFCRLDVLNFFAFPFLLHGDQVVGIGKLNWFSFGGKTLIVMDVYSGSQHHRFYIPGC